jgi:hypothetical protein
LLACNSNSSKEKTADKKQTDSMAPLPPPRAEVSPEVKKCYSNDGLKYNTVITIVFGDKNNVTGNVTSEELETGKKETIAFEGISLGDKLAIKFKGTAPVIGDASEWTDKPWTIKKAGGKETLVIVFNAKNYDTNKWEDTDYQFAQVDCK